MVRSVSLPPRSTLVTGVLPRVWLVDDSPLEIEHTRGILSRAYQVETFTDGASLLERLAQPGIELPELLLLDWLMPGVTGLEACHFLREHYGPTDLPILVLTASTHEGALEEAFAAGANDYVAKPARAVELLARVRALLQTRHDAKALRERERDRSLLLTEVEAERTRLTTILSTLEEGVMLHDVQGVVRFSNAAAKRLLGRTSEQMAGRPPMDPGWGAVREDGSPLPAEERAPMLALRTGQSVRGVIMGVRHSDGRLVWLSCNAQPYFGQDAKTLAGVVASFFDVTAQRAASSERERLLGEVEAARVRLETLFENAPAAICTLRGPDHVFELINPTYQRLVGLGRPLVGLPVREALPELVEQGFLGQLDEVYRSGIAFLANEVLVRLNRRGEGILEDVFIYQLYQPVRDASGQVVGIDVFGFDVTEQVRARKEAERLMGLEKERASFEQQLIGIVSHDLRNPVAAIMMGASILLRRPDVEERQRRTAERILVSAGRANRLIHDLLDFTQARLGGGLRVKRVPSDFHAILRQVVEESQVSSPGRVLRLVQQGSGEGAWDGDRLAQLVSNLLANAVHYSPPDSAVSIEMRGEPNELVLTVHNSGAPIPLEVLPHLFQPMQRGVAEVSEARSVGLGLYIVDQVVRAHRGSVEVASTAEAGTTFTVRLPRAH